MPAMLDGIIDKGRYTQFMKITFYEKGARINAMSFAGEDCQLWSDLGIEANIFETEKIIYCPLIKSDNPGSGNLDEFLRLMKKECGGKKLIFNSVINNGIKGRLKKAGIEFN